MTDLSLLIPLCLQSARRALQWRLLVLYLLALLPPLALLVFPAWTVFDAQLSHSVHAAALAQQLDLSAMTDLLAAGQRQALAVKVALAAALVCTALLSPLLAGATLTAARNTAPLPRSLLSATRRAAWPLSGATRPAGVSPSQLPAAGTLPGRPQSGSPLSGEPLPDRLQSGSTLAIETSPGRPQSGNALSVEASSGRPQSGSLSAKPPAAPQSFGALLAGGVAEYPRMLRMLLWSAVVMGAVLLADSLLVAWAQPQEALLPDEGKIAVYAARAVSALLVWLAVASLDAGRAALVADRRRRSAIGAWWLGVVLLFRHPVLALGSYAVLGVMGFAMAGLFGLARLHAPTGTLAGDIGGVLLTQALVLLLAWFRSARLFALMTVARP
jgi:hypothetical protein